MERGLIMVDLTPIDHIPPSELAAYFDGAVSDERAAAVEAHLTDCLECRARIAVMSGARQAVRLLPVPAAPERVWDRIDRRLRPAPPARSLAPARPPRRRGAPSAGATRGGHGRPSSGARPWLLVSVLLVVLSTLVAATPLGSRLLATIQPEDQGIDYGLYIAGTTDARAMERFVKRYRRQRVAARPQSALSERLIGGGLLAAGDGRLVPRAAYTLTDDGARLVQVTFASEGSQVDVFRQPEGHPFRVDGQRLRRATVAGVDCRLAETSGFRVLTFAKDGQRFVVVAPRGTRTAEHVVTALSQ